MQYHSLLEHVPDEEQTFTNVWKVHATSDGIYFRTATHLFRWSEGQLKFWKPSTEFHRSFWVNDALYIRAWDVGLLTMDSDSLVMAEWGENFAEQRVDLMLPFGDQGILIGTRTDGLFLYNENGNTPFVTDANAYLKENHLYDGTVLTDGTVALATLRGGVVQIDTLGRFLQTITKEDGILDNTVWAVGQDREDGLWLMLNKGISRVELPSPFSVFTEKQGLEGSVESLVLHQDVLFAATHSWSVSVNGPR